MIVFCDEAVPPNLIQECVMPDAIIVGSFVHLLQAFTSCFTAPSFSTFVTLMAGWSLATGRHTVTGVVRAANAVGWGSTSARSTASSPKGVGFPTSWACSWCDSWSTGA